MREPSIDALKARLERWRQRLTEGGPAWLIAVAPRTIELLEADIAARTEGQSDE